MVVDQRQMQFELQKEDKLLKRKLRNWRKTLRRTLANMNRPKLWYRSKPWSVSAQVSSLQRLVLRVFKENAGGDLSLHT